MDEQSKPGHSVETRCQFCGTATQAVSRDERRPQHYQVVVTCAQCGKSFAAFSRN